MTIHNLAADMAARIPEMARSNPSDNADVFERMMRESGLLTEARQASEGKSLRSWRSSVWSYIMKTLLLALLIPAGAFAQQASDPNPKGHPPAKALTVLEQQFNSDAARWWVVSQKISETATLLRADKEAKQSISANQTRLKQLQSGEARLLKSLNDLQPKIDLARKQAWSRHEPCSDVKVYKGLGAWGWRYVISKS